MHQFAADVRNVLIATLLLAAPAAAQFARVVADDPASGDWGVGWRFGSKTALIYMDEPAGSVNWKFPNADGSAGEQLTTDGAGTWSWASPGGSGTTPGNDREILTSDGAGGFRAFLEMTWNDEVMRLQKRSDTMVDSRPALVLSHLNASGSTTPLNAKPVIQIGVVDTAAASVTGMQLSGTVTDNVAGTVDVSAQLWARHNGTLKRYLLAQDGVMEFEQKVRLDTLEVPHSGGGNWFRLDSPSADTVNLTTTDLIGSQVFRVGSSTHRMGAEVFGSVAIAESGGSDLITVSAPSISSPYSLTLPTTDGSANECLQTNGTGTLNWTTCLDSWAVSSSELFTISGGGLDTWSFNASNDLMSIDFNDPFAHPLWRFGDGLSPDVDVEVTGWLRLSEPGSGSDGVTLVAPSLSSSYTLTLPPDDGAGGECLETNGFGALDWENCRLITSSESLTILAGIRQYDLEASGNDLDLSDTSGGGRFIVGPDVLVEGFIEAWSDISVDDGTEYATIRRSGVDGVLELYNGTELAQLRGGDVQGAFDSGFEFGESIYPDSDNVESNGLPEREWKETHSRRFCSNGVCGSTGGCTGSQQPQFTEGLWLGSCI